MRQKQNRVRTIMSTIKIAVLSVMTFVVALAPTAASAATGVGGYQWQYGCNYSRVPVSKTVQFGTGPVLGYIKIQASNGCDTWWGHFLVTNNNQWYFDVSIWNPGNATSTHEYSTIAPATTWFDTRMREEIKGKENCVGAQVYTRTNPAVHIGWVFGGCYTPST